MSDVAPVATLSPHLVKEWQQLRHHLAAAAAAANHAAATVTADEARPLIATAQHALIDATFWLAHIERDCAGEPLAGMEL